MFKRYCCGGQPPAARQAEDPAGHGGAGCGPPSGWSMRSRPSDEAAGRTRHRLVQSLAQAGVSPRYRSQVRLNHRQYLSSPRGGVSAVLLLLAVIACWPIKLSEPALVYAGHFILGQPSGFRCIIPIGNPGQPGAALPRQSRVFAGELRRYRASAGTAACLSGADSELPDTQPQRWMWNKQQVDRRIVFIIPPPQRGLVSPGACD